MDSTTNDKVDNSGGKLCELAMHPYDDKIHELTLDDEGYMKSYSLQQRDEYISFFKQHGFVVIHDMLDDDECKKSCDEVWLYLEQYSTSKQQRSTCQSSSNARNQQLGQETPNAHSTIDKSQQSIDRSKPSTWSEQQWPKTICRNGGFMGKFPYWKRMSRNNLQDTFVSKQPQAWKNRENEGIYEAFQHILTNHKLWVSIDRYGVMRPSNHKESEDVMESWSTKPNWLHWDLSPFHFGTSAAGYAPASNHTPAQREVLQQTYGSLRVQGLVTLTDCPSRNGGFHCVPGFHHSFHDWRASNIDDYGSQPEIARRNFIEVPPNDTMRKHICRVPMRKGSLLIWNSMLPHGNFPNTSTDDFRMVQYIKMIPVDDPREFQPAIPSCSFSFDEWFPDGFEVSPLGKRLYGLESWNEVE